MECNHATLSGHSCEHELQAASIQGLLGNVDINTGDPQVGWDTDQFLTSPEEATRLMLVILSQGGLQPGGLNFDAKLRRESTSIEDLFYAHISGMDAMARGLRQAAAILNEGRLSDLVKRFQLKIRFRVIYYVTMKGQTCKAETLLSLILVPFFLQREKKCQF